MDVRAIDAPVCGLVTANLTGSFFVQYAGQLSRCVRPGGRFVAGGLTTLEEPDVRAAFAPALSPVARSSVEDGWVALTLRRERAGATAPGRHR